ncbi:MAG: DUF3419 family protein [Candidatus Aminicenantes bacterium]|nr:DUF3419 family protein [Candidatus Aminicenantes bacterium]
MSTLSFKIRKFEFENRIFISFGIVFAVCVMSFTLFMNFPVISMMIGRLLGISLKISHSMGFFISSLFAAAASFLRIWAGSLLSSQRMMAFPVQNDTLIIKGPYRVIRNPIYFADLIAFSGFTFVLPPIGLLLPLLLFIHYKQLIQYEELSLERRFPAAFQNYKKRVPPLLPNPKNLKDMLTACLEFSINRDGLRHNGVYLLLIPGFITAAFTRNIFHAVIIGLPGIIDWAVIHTKIGRSAPRIAESTEDKTVEIKKNKMFRDILYGQCWEDPEMDRTALQINSDDVVFSITSGGCNVLSFLIDNPKQVIALDINPHQNYLLELKMAAFHELTHKEILGFMGVTPSPDRLRYYRRVRPWLSPESSRYWDKQGAKIKKGIIHSGRFEKYMRLLRKTIIRPLISKKVIDLFYASEDQAERKRLFHEKWENIWWWILTRIMLSRRFNSLFFDKAFFKYLDQRFSFGRHFADKAEKALTGLPMKKNYFLSYILRGNYTSPDDVPPYLKRENYSAVRSRLNRVRMVTSSCEEFFSSIPENSISKFNFSNIFEWMSDKEFENLLFEILRVADSNAVMTYRNLLVHREHPSPLNGYIQSQRELAQELHSQDLSFIYNNYVIEKIIKGESG